MKAILIDSRSQSINVIDFAGGLQEIYRLLGCDVVDAVYLPNGDCIYVDDEGLLKGPTQFFYAVGMYAPLAGNGLVVGSGKDGEDADCLSTLEDLQINFLTPSEALAMAEALSL